MAKERILVADDSKEVAAFLQGYLTQQGYEVQVAYDGETAVRLFLTQPSALVLTDLQMPRLNGLGVLHRVKERAPDTQVVILTGHASLDTALDALRHGAYDYLLKPVENVDQLQFTINRALLQRRLTVENRRLVEELQQANALLGQKVAEQTGALREAYEQLQRARQHEVLYRNARLATGLLHQINNAVSNIPELLDELEALDWPETAREPLEELRLNAVAADHLRKWLHQFVEIGNLSLDPVDLPALAVAVVQRLENRRPSHVRVYGPLVDGRVPDIRADRALIDILIENLLRNGYEAIPEGRDGAVGMWIAADGAHCSLRFRDNGEGIRPEDRDRIWEWGWTTKPTGPQAHDRGLGLYACRQIVAAHDGTIDLEHSTRRDGTSFLVRLPIAGPRPIPGE